MCKHTGVSPSHPLFRALAAKAVSLYKLSSRSRGLWHSQSDSPRASWHPLKAMSSLPLRSFLVGDVLVRHPDLCGLDSVAELCAVDGPEAGAVPRGRPSARPKVMADRSCLRGTEALKGSQLVNMSS